MINFYSDWYVKINYLYQKALRFYLNFIIHLYQDWYVEKIIKYCYSIFLLFKT